MTARPLRVGGLLIVALALMLLGHLFAPLLLAMAPAWLLLALAWCGRYPGERLVEALATRAVRRRARPARGCRRHDAPRLLARGGALLAAALAGRGPPLLPAPRRNGARR